jgi:iron complex outermembrane receptor protein
MFRSFGLPAIRRSRGLSLAAAGTFSLAVVSSAAAQSATAPAPPDDPLRVKLPTVTVTAQKESEDKQKVPVSVTAVPEDTLEAADVHIVSQAAIFAPGTFFTEFSARKLSNARFRGIGSSPGNPAITTVIDGVPQLHANSSSSELLDVHQIEFVRGPQGALFGRNTLGGLVNISSVRPSLSRWTGAVTVPVGNYGSWAVRGGVSGPIVKDKVSFSGSFAQVDREGFTVNDVTGNDIDARSAFSGKAQLLFVPNAAWEGRVIFSGERARDGDYSLNDVGSLQASPFHASRDFEGFVNRDIFGTTILLQRRSGPISFWSTTGFVDWKTQDVTDLDYSPLPLATRDNAEEDFQFSQELRFASSDGSPIKVSDAVNLRWQGGLFLFSQNYKQDAINSFSPFVIAPFALSQHSPRSSLDDVGIGLFGQGTFAVRDRLDLSVGARFDYEDKSASLESFFEPAIAPPNNREVSDSFSNVSPQFSAAYRVRPNQTVYATAGRGYKAGGFNPASPAGSEAYGEEQTWLVEGGVKTLWAGDRVSANVAVFHMDWDDLQLNVPNPSLPSEFFISNVGAASSSGLELELNARAARGLDLLAACGYTRARFGAGAVSNGVNVEDNKIPNQPDYTFTIGGQYSRDVGRATLLGRADAVFYGAFQYDDQNSLSQKAFSLVNLRFAATARLLFGEVVIRNAFDTRYIPVAFPYPGFAPSGFIGEMGAPRTVSAGIGVRF